MALLAFADAFWSYIFHGALSVFLFQVQVLRNAGEEVTLTVSFLKRAPAFLKLPLNEDCACKPLLSSQKKTLFSGHECLKLAKLLCIEGDLQNLFWSALLPEYELLILPGLVVTFTSSKKLLSLLIHTSQTPCDLFLSKVAGKTVELH